MLFIAIWRAGFRKSHMLTYLTVLTLSFGRSPVIPWRRLKGERWNFVATGISTCISVSRSIVSMKKCSDNWPFSLVSVWKLIFSLTLTVMTVHAVRIASKLFPEKKQGFEFVERWLEVFKRPTYHDRRYRTRPQRYPLVQSGTSWGWYGSEHGSCCSPEQRQYSGQKYSQWYPYDPYRTSSTSCYSGHERRPYQVNYGIPEDAPGGLAMGQ